MIRPRPSQATHPDWAFRVNPYTRWVHEHPEVLLARPTPAALAQRLRAAGPPGAPLHVELGCGSGNVLLQLGAARPGVHFVGFELRYKRLVKAARKVERLGLTNVWFLREQAENCFDYFPPGTVDTLAINFPDPWPKAVQWRKRLVGAPFLERLHATLRPGGTLRLKTDHSGYFLHVLSLIRNRPEWRIRTFSNDLHRHGKRAGDAVSEFEQLFISKGRAVFCLVLEKAAAAP